jgi:glycosyltransferase involved in cell wall biosynthesis
MKAASAIITLSGDMKATLAGRGIDASKVHIIPNFAIDRAPESVVRQDGSHVPTLIYAGNHGKVQNLYFFLRATQLARATCDFRVEMLGDGSQLAALQQLAARDRMTHVTFVGVVPREEAQRRIAGADAGIVPAMPGLYDVAFPSKIMSYLIVGLPVLVLAEERSSIANFLHEHGMGLVASPTDLSQTAEAICRLVRGLQQQAYDSGQIARRSATLFSRETYLASYSEVFTKHLNVEARVA